MKINYDNMEMHYIPVFKEDDIRIANYKKQEGLKNKSVALNKLLDKLKLK